MDRPSPARLLPAVVAVSGATGLVYQSLWMRSFGLVFGNTTDAVALVLAIFMGGIALGSLLAARRPARRPLAAYAKVELGIGATALLSWPLLKALPAVYAALATRVDPDGPAELLGRSAAAAVVLLPTTILLGATVPLVVEHLARAGEGLRQSLGRLYLLNTLGGAAGIALGTFVLVPNLGLDATLIAAACLNLVAGGLARNWSREAEAGVPTAATAAPGGSPPALFAALAFASGAFSFGIEVLWTRSLVLVIGSSVYSFNLVLLAVLLGIAGGTVMYQRLRGRFGRPHLWLGGFFLAAGLSALLGELAVGRLPDAYLALIEVLPVGFAAHQLAAFALCLLVLLPTTLALGITFPLVAHLVETEGAQRTSGLLYAWNTAGAIVGALFADLVLVRRLGLQPSYVLLAALPLAGGAWALAEGLGWRRAGRLAAVAASLAVVAPLCRLWRPWDPLRVTAGVYKYGLEWRERPGFRLADLARERRILFYEEGREAVVAVAESVSSGRRYLSVNGKTDAGSGAEDVLTQRFIAHVPLLLHPAPRRVLVVGWGAGATAASAARHPVERLECVEIEPATWRAAPLFAALSGQLREDPRFRIAFRDGRNHLLRSPEPWDVVISEPSNPWISGVSNLFTREFYEVVRDRLAPGGVFGQWFHYYNLEPADVKVELATFAHVFPHASLWLVPPLPNPEGGTLTADVLLVGSQEPQALDWGRLRRAFADGPLRDDLRSTGVLRDEASLLAAWAMGRAEIEAYAQDPVLFPRGTPLNSDGYPWIEFAAPRRNVLAPAEVARMARAQYEALAEVASEPLAPLRGHPGLDAKGPDGAALLREVAARHVEAARPQRALRALQAAVALDPSSAVTRSRLAGLLLDRGDANAAEAAWREAVRLDPAQAETWERLGGLSLDRRDYAGAVEAHRALVRLRPADVPARLRLGAVLARLGRWAEARDVLHEARRLDPAAPIEPALLAHIEREAAAAR
jgi:spermidine synthase